MIALKVVLDSVENIGFIFPVLLFSDIVAFRKSGDEGIFSECQFLNTQKTLTLFSICLL